MPLAGLQIIFKESIEDWDLTDNEVLHQYKIKPQKYHDTISEHII